MNPYWHVKREWKNEIVVILGGGPSAVAASHSFLASFRVITINDSFRLYPAADILYFCDLCWWEKRQQEVWNNFQGERLVTLENDIPGVLRLRNTGSVDLETEPDGLRHGSNSGYQAINLAFHMGARRIVLVGFDMRIVAETAHWNTDHVMQQNEAGFALTLRQVMLPKFETLRTPLEAAGVEVFNATPNSALTVWPYVPLREALQLPVAF